MRITYARMCVWMRLIRFESEFAGFAFNALLNLHSCRQALVCSILCGRDQKEVRQKHESEYNRYIYAKKNTLGVKKVQGQSETALQICMCDQKL